MLVLSRKVGEKIVIGNNVTIVVQRIGKGRVALAIEAPHDITVLRGELAPFGVDNQSIEFLDDNGAAPSAPLPLPGGRINSESIPRQTKPPITKNNRLRDEASSRSAFPRSTTPLNPATDSPASRLPRPFPSR